MGGGVTLLAMTLEAFPEEGATGILDSTSAHSASPHHALCIPGVSVTDQQQVSPPPPAYFQRLYGGQEGAVPIHAVGPRHGTT